MLLHLIVSCVCLYVLHIKHYELLLLIEIWFLHYKVQDMRSLHLPWSLYDVYMDQATTDLIFSVVGRVNLMKVWWQPT